MIDASQPWNAVNSDFHNLTLVVPRRLLLPSLTHDGDHHGRVIDSQNPYGELLLSYFVGLKNSLEKMSLQDAAEAGRFGLNLLSASLNRVSSTPRTENKISLHLLKRSVKQYLECHLQDANLTIDSVAEAFRISRSHLYRLFDAEGGIANYIRTRRMDIALRRLLAPGQNAESVSEVASSVGYRNPSAFTRAFKQRFNFAPTEAREYSHAQYGLASGGERPVWEKWFRTL